MLQTRPETTHTLRQVEALAGDSLADVRRIVAELTPSELEDNALAAALERMLQRFGEEPGVVTVLHEATVKSHLVHIFTKLGVESRARAIHVAGESGLLRPHR